MTYPTYTPASLARLPLHGPYHVLARGTECDEDDICEPATQTLVIHLADYVVLENLLDALDANQSVEEETHAWLVEHFRPQHCTHDWDCCGCRHGYATAKHIAGYQWLVQIHTARNY